MKTVTETRSALFPYCLLSFARFSFPRNLSKYVKCWKVLGGLFADGPKGSIKKHIHSTKMMWEGITVGRRANSRKRRGCWRGPQLADWVGDCA